MAGRREGWPGHREKEMRRRNSNPFNYRARGVTSDNRPIFAETHEQITVARWLVLHKIFFIHPVNEGKRKRTTGRILKLMGMTAGASDFLIFDPPPLLPGYVGAVLEMKALDGDEPTPKQYEFLSEMGARRYANAWRRGSDAAIQWLESLGYGKKR